MITFHYVSFMLYGMRNTMVFKSQFTMNEFVNNCEEYYGENFRVLAFFERMV